MKFIIAVLALVASASAIQDSKIPSDLEVSPSGMSQTCAKIFEKLQSKDVNDRRDECKRQYKDNDDPTQVACKIKCILINTGFIDRESGGPLIQPFRDGVQTVYKGNEKMIDRVVAAFNWCYSQVEHAHIDPTTCANPSYTHYGLCLYEMVRKLCQKELNDHSNVQEPWAKNFI